MDIKGYVGIDFGTANSHFAYCEVTDGSVRASMIRLDGAQGGMSVPSYLLWKIGSGEKKAPCAYGAPAVDEWHLSDDQEGYILSGAFKPDLASSKMARDSAREFLAFARKNMDQTNNPPGGVGAKKGIPVVIGVPAQISTEHRERTKEVAMQAGFGEVVCLEEPLGAVGYHLAYKEIDEEHLDQGVVVVDFGGGTLDIATVDRDGVKEPWGDPQLGGRLFDDLFYQWVVDSSNIDPADFDKSELLAIWWVKCRRLKENFSNHWKRKLDAGENGFNDFKSRITTRDDSSFGSLRNASLDEFLERARSYRPSHLAIDYFKRIDSSLAQLGASKPVDLLDWVKSVVANGPVHKGKSYGTVILTGGSSSWPFMNRIVQETFGDCKILTPNAPECTIGEGLAMYNVLRTRYTDKKHKAIADVSSLASKLDSLTTDITKRAAQDISNKIVGEIMQISHKEFHAWRLHGGKLENVEKAVAQNCKRIPAKHIAEQRIEQLLPEIAQAGTDAVRSWLRQHDIYGTYEGMQFGGGISVRDLTLSITLSDELANTAVEQAVFFVSAAIVGGLLLVIAATSVTLAATPLAFILVPAGIIGVFGGKDWMKKQLMTHDFSDDTLSWLQKLYSKEDLDKALKKGEEQCRSAVLEAVEDAMKDVRIKLDVLVNGAKEEVFRRFGLLESLSKMN